MSAIRRRRFSNNHVVVNKSFAESSNPFLPITFNWQLACRIEEIPYSRLLGRFLLLEWTRRANGLRKLSNDRFDHCLAFRCVHAVARFWSVLHDYTNCVG